MSTLQNKMTREEFEEYRKQHKIDAYNRKELTKQRKLEELQKNRLERQQSNSVSTVDAISENEPIETIAVNDQIDTQKSSSSKAKVENPDQLGQDNSSVTKSNYSGASKGGMQNKQGNGQSTGTFSASSSLTPSVNAENLIARSNVLHDYAPYNYIITLSCIDKNHFNEGREGDGLIIARSGGKGVTGLPPLDKDFYIDDLVIRNTITPTESSGTGTAYQVLFNVTEPYGVSFIDALILAADTQGYNNHLKAVYKIKIEFKGINDDGIPTNNIEFSTREIPIHIYAVEMDIDAGVSTYQVQAVPATNLAFTQYHGTTREAYTVQGDTVDTVLKDLFASMNRSQSTLVDNGKINLPDEFELDTSQCKKIVKTKIGYDQKSDSKSVINYSHIYDTATSKTFYRGINVPKGTNIQSFIEALIRESDFYKDQFDDNMEPKDEKMTIARVYTQLEILGDNNGNNRPQYKFKWVVRTQDVTAAYFSKTPEDLTKDLIPMRTYDYLYTGKNQDVLNFDISYKFGYYQAIPYTESTGNDPKTSSFDGTKPEETDNDQTGAASKGVTATTKEPEESRYNSGFNLSVNKKNGEIGRMFEQIVADPSADLLVTTLEIIGDPYWIAQKEVTNRPFTLSHIQGNPNTDAVGAVATDESEIFIELNFLTPQDINDETGLFLNNQRVSFSGKYKVFICANRFSGGMFTNELEMVRMRFQEDDEPVNSGSSKDGLQKKQGVGRYNPTKPAFLSDLGSSAGDNGVSGDNTGDNVTKVPVGSNISRQYTGANRGGFVPEGFDVTDRLPDPNIIIEFGNPYYTKQQLDLVREFAPEYLDKSRINPDGY